MWQAEADTDLTLSTLPAVAVGQMLLTMAKFCSNTVRPRYIQKSLLFGRLVWRCLPKWTAL